MASETHTISLRIIVSMLGPGVLPGGAKSPVGVSPYSRRPITFVSSRRRPIRTNGCPTPLPKHHRRVVPDRPRHKQQSHHWAMGNNSVRHDRKGGYRPLWHREQRLRRSKSGDPSV